MFLQRMYSAAAYDLGDTRLAYLDKPEFLRRAAERAVADLDRIAPNETVWETAIGTQAITNLAFASGVLNTWVSLSTGPIKEGSEVVTNTAGTTTYKRDDDYTMNYYEGKIKCLSTGTMVTLTNYLIDYTKDGLSVDISSIKPDIISIQKVEYPVGNVPQTTMNWEVWGDYLVLKGTGRESQTLINDDTYLRIYYTTGHTLPTENDRPTWRKSLDDVMVRGMSAYVMSAKATQLLLESQENINLATVCLGTMDTEAALIDTRLATIAGLVSLASGALSGVAARLSATDIALLAVLTHHNLAETALAASESWESAADTMLDTVSSSLGGVSGGLLAADADLALAESKLLTVPDHNTGAAEPSAKYYLTTGSPLINKINLGEGVSTAYQQYASSALDMARQVSEQVIAYLTATERHLTVADRYLADVTARTTTASARVDQQRARLQQAQIEVSMSGDAVQEGQIRNQSASILVEQARQYTEQAQAVYFECVARFQSMGQRVGQGQTYLESAVQSMELSDRCKTESLYRMRDFQNLLNISVTHLTTVRAPRVQPS